MFISVSVISKGLKINEEKFRLKYQTYSGIRSNRNLHYFVEEANERLSRPPVKSTKFKSRLLSKLRRKIIENNTTTYVVEPQTNSYTKKYSTLLIILGKDLNFFFFFKSIAGRTFGLALGAVVSVDSFNFF